MWLVASRSHILDGDSRTWKRPPAKPVGASLPVQARALAATTSPFVPGPLCGGDEAHHPRCRGHGRRSHCRGLASASGARRAAPASARCRWRRQQSSRDGFARLRLARRVVHAIRQCPLRGRAQEHVQPNKSQGAGPVPLWCGVGGRRTGNQRGLSGCRASPQRPRRWSRTATTRRASSCPVTPAEAIVTVPPQGCCPLAPGFPLGGTPPIASVMPVNIAQQR